MLYTRCVTCGPNAWLRAVIAAEMLITLLLILSVLLFPLKTKQCFSLLAGSKTRKAKSFFFFRLGHLLFFFAGVRPVHRFALSTTTTNYYYYYYY